MDITALSAVILTILKLICRHVCTTQKNVTVPVKTKESYCKPVYKKYVERCSNNQICTGVRLVFETAYRDVLTTTTTTQVIYICCPGWGQVNNRSHGCNKPQCSAKCLNGGSCVKPDLCTCPKGFTGRYCEADINECKEQKPCDQICHNTPGSFKCECRETFALQSDGQSCRKEAQCSAKCLNGGSCVKPDLCTCPKGFTGRYCEADINECKEQKPCDQICHNTPGSFKCECRETFALQSDGQSCRKEGGDGPALEAKDLEYELLDKRLFKLETMLHGQTNTTVGDNSEMQKLTNNIESMTKDISWLKIKFKEVEKYKSDMSIMKNKINQLERKANKVEEIGTKSDKMKTCISSNKICV